MMRVFAITALMIVGGCGLGQRMFDRGAEPEAMSFAGAVCGDPAIKGEVIGAVPGRIPGCGIEDAVQITSVAGIGLSQAALMDCGTAQALRQWTDDSARPAMAGLGKLVGYRVAAHYVCKTRNSQPGARISEHGKGKAIDISGFELEGGEVISVSDGWNGTRGRAALRAAHGGACGPFGTVLGPDSDRFHQSHFHLDTASHRGGPYCR